MVSRPSTPVLVLVALVLFLVWSNSFIAIGYLLGADEAAPRTDWIGLTVLRFIPAGLICGAYCLYRRREAWDILRKHPLRVLFCGVLTVPGYNLALYYGQQHGVPAPIAALTTALVPLFVMLMAAVFLAERLTLRRVAGFLISVTGMGLIASAKSGDVEAYPLLIAVTAGAPLCWSVFSVISKPLAGRIPMLVWTYLCTAVGTLLALPLIPLTGNEPLRQAAALDATGWGALLFLAVPCTVLGFAIWTWLLRFLPASTVGFTVFLNPPLTTSSKYLFSLLLPTVFVFDIRPLEWLGGAVTLAGLAVAVWVRGSR
ncbi:hypothetical protein ABI59_00710 [Acidobacteria bacterium Mor1]|nr:hypothetical protein ABI59_00710 [Acidobacteria bacterium Mor1]